MNTLRLTLNKKWFDLILLGVKTEEYREIKDYWSRRLTIETGSEPTAFEFKKFDQIEFKNGYRPDSPTFTIECKGIKIGRGNPDWGAEPAKLYYVLELGKLIFKTDK